MADVNTLEEFPTADQVAAPKKPPPAAAAPKNNLEEFPTALPSTSTPAPTKPRQRALGAMQYPGGPLEMVIGKTPAAEQRTAEELGMPFVDESGKDETPYLNKSPPPAAEINQFTKGPGGEDLTRVPTHRDLSSAELHLQQIADQNLAAVQGVSPNATSKYFPAENQSVSLFARAAPANAPQLLGPLEDEDIAMGGNRTYTATNKMTGKPQSTLFNPQTDFIARDPATGNLAVYGRTQQANENRLTAASRIIAPYLATGPVTSVPTRVESAEEIAQRIAANPPTTAAEAARAAQPQTTIGDASLTRLAEDNVAEIERDVESFDRLGVRKPPIVFGRGVAGFGQMLSRVPFLGNPIRNALESGLQGAADAARGISNWMHPTANVEEAGQTLQRGLERYRAAGVEDLEPEILRDMGIQPSSPGPYVGELRNLPPPIPGAPAPAAAMPRQVIVRPDGTTVPLTVTRTSDGRALYTAPRVDASGETHMVPHVVVNDAGRSAVYEAAGRGQPIVGRLARGRQVRSDAIRAQDRQAGVPPDTAQTTRGIPVRAARSLDQTIHGRRGVEDLSDAELGTLLRRPASETSFLARAEALYERAWRSLPNMFRINASRNPSRLGTPNTRAALTGIRNQIANQIAGQNTLRGDLAARIVNPNSHFSLGDIRAMRTEIGRALSGYNPLVANLSRQQLSSLYQGLSRDMEIGIQDLANRARIASRFSSNRSDFVPLNDALRANNALRAFRTADRYFRAGNYRMDTWTRLLGTDNPQQAIGILLNATTEGVKGNYAMLRNAMAVLRPEEQNQIRAMAVERLGKPQGNVGGMIEKVGFSPQSFFTRWNNMDPKAREILFGGEYAEAMNDLFNVVRRLRNQQALANTSFSGSDLINWITAEGGVGMIYTGHGALFGAMAIPPAVFGLIMGQPKYVRWIAAYARAKVAMRRLPQSGAPRVAVLVNQLNRMAIREPALIPFRNAIAAENGIGQGDDKRQRQNAPVGVQPPQ